MKCVLAWMTLALLGLCFQKVVTDESDNGVVSDTPAADATVEVDAGEAEGAPAALMSGTAESRTYSAHWPNNNMDCYVGSTIIRHGSVGAVTSLNPCWKKLCWNGRLEDREDGCYYQNQCYNLNSHFEIDCVTYSCTKILTGASGSMRSWRYRVQSIQQKCRDASGRCRRTGERGYSGYINGRYYRNCECRSDGFTVCYSSYP